MKKFILYLLAILFNTTFLWGNFPPSITNISPLFNTTVVSGNNYFINYNVFDVEPNPLLVNLYYSTNTSILGANIISLSNFVSQGFRTNIWNTTGVKEGQYYIIGRVLDFSNTWSTNHSPSRVFISNTSIVGPTNTPPTIFNISPLSPITVSSGSSYNIRYFINDTEDTNLMVLLYYSTTTNLIGSTIIFSNYRPLGTNVYNWDTTGITQNYYYMLGRVRDSSNVWAFNYSSSRVFVSNASVISTNTNISDNTPPAPPTGIIMTPANKRITLQWNPNTEPDFKEYYVYRKSLSDINFTIITVTSINSHEDKHLVNGMLYYYKLRAADTNNNVSDYSITVQGMPANFNRKNVAFNDNKITPKDPQELYINVQPMNNDFSGSVTVRIYNVAMKLIKQTTINNSNGQYLYRWDLKDANNINVPTGVYFIYVEGYNWKTYKTVYIIK